VQRVVFVLVAALVGVVVGQAARADTTKRSQLDRYLSGMSWPLRASVLRAMSASRAIDGVVTYGDPPFLGQVAIACERFRDVEAVGARRGVGAILRIAPPAPVALNHARLSRAYAEARVGCARAQRLARAALRKADSAPVRVQLRAFGRITLRDFFNTVRAWRSAMLREAAAIQLQPPGWLRSLSVEP
jgi:hypothetical protein